LQVLDSSRPLGGLLEVVRQLRRDFLDIAGVQRRQLLYACIVVFMHNTTR
jgi:hypothetical protein